MFYSAVKEVKHKTASSHTYLKGLLMTTSVFSISSLIFKTFDYLRLLVHYTLPRYLVLSKFLLVLGMAAK